MDLVKSIKKRQQHIKQSQKDSEQEKEAQLTEVNFNEKKESKEDQTSPKVYTTQEASLKGNAFTIGLATFDSKFTEQHCHQLISKSVEKNLQQTTWLSHSYYLSNGDREQCILLFSFMKKAECQELQLFNIYEPLILKTLSRIQFPQLKLLCLQNCGIFSIETLLFLNAPNIQVLEIERNQIHIIKPLLKYNHSFKLQYFSVHQNPVSVIDISRMQLPSGAQNELRFECDRGSSCMSQDLNCLAKIEPVQLKKIIIGSKKRMPQRNKLASIKNKFINTQVRVYHS